MDAISCLVFLPAPNIALYDKLTCSAGHQPILQCLQRECTQSGDANGIASIVVHLQRNLILWGARDRQDTAGVSAAGSMCKAVSNATAVFLTQTDCAISTQISGTWKGWSMRPPALLQGYPVIWGARDRQDTAGASAAGSMRKAVFEATGVFLPQTDCAIPTQIKRTRNWQESLIARAPAGVSCSMGSRGQARHWRQERWQEHVQGSPRSRWRCSRARERTAWANSAGRQSALCASSLMRWSLTRLPLPQHVIPSEPWW